MGSTKQFHPGLLLAVIALLLAVIVGLLWKVATGGPPASTSEGTAGNTLPQRQGGATSAAPAGQFRDVPSSAAPGQFGPAAGPR